MDEPDAALAAASDAIDRACPEHEQRDPDAAARFQAQTEATARVTRETFGEPRTETLTVTWTQLRAAMWPPPEPPVQLRIDLNARTHDGRYVPARRSHASGPVKRGDNIIVYEPEDGVATTATVMRVYGDWVHLDVDWDYMVDTTAGYDETADHSYRDKVNAPLRPETIAALNARLAAGNMPTVIVPRRKAVKGETT